MTQKERLLKLILNSPFPKDISQFSKLSAIECDIYCSDIESFVDYLLSNGVIVPPCKVGDTVYLFWDHDDMAKEYTVLGYISDAFGLWIQIQYNQGGAIWNARISEFGKTIFPSKEEAEQALKERENN